MDSGLATSSRPGMTAEQITHASSFSRGICSPRFVHFPSPKREGAERRQALGCLRGTLRGPVTQARRRIALPRWMSQPLLSGTLDTLLLPAPGRTEAHRRPKPFEEMNGRWLAQTFSEAGPGDTWLSLGSLWVLSWCAASRHWVRLIANTRIDCTTQAANVAVRRGYGIAVTVRSIPKCS